MSEQVQEATTAPEAVEQETSAVEETTPEQGAVEVTEGSDQSDAENKVEDLKKELKDPKLSKSEKKEIQKQIKKYELVVNGRKVSREIDLSDDESLKRYLQKAEAADQKFQESAALRKQVEQFIDLMRQTPDKALKQMGIDPKKFAEEYINREIENSAKSPEQLEKERLQSELEELKERYKKDEEERKTKEFERLQAESEQKLESEIGEALETGNLPKTPYTVKKMAEVMMLALQNDIDLSPKDVLPLIRKQMQQEIKDLFAASSDDLFEEMFKDNISRVRKKSVSKAKAAVETANSVKPTLQQQKPQAPQEDKKISMKDFLRGNF